MLVALEWFLVALLIGLTAFFVAAEFSFVKLRPSRADQMVMEGRRHALAVQRVLSNLDGYLSACRLGMILTALGLGWLGAVTVERTVTPLLVRLEGMEQSTAAVSTLVAFLLVAFLYIVLGELVPKTAAVQKTEKVAAWCALPVIGFYWLMFPALWLLRGSASLLAGLFGLRKGTGETEAHSEEEIRHILSESYESGKINKTELSYVSRIFTFDDLLAREIMVPRTDMVCLYLNKTLEENLRIIKREQYTRFPVARESKDHIVGFINTKQFFLKYDNNPDFKLAGLLMPPMTVPDVMPVKSLLKKMQAEQVHIALLLDEYGGTSGIITIEDILEEIVGEIRDEFDKDESKAIEMVEPGHYRVEGKVLLSELNELLGTELPNDDVDTIGGWIYSERPEVRTGDTWEHDDLTITVTEMDKHRILKAELHKL
ncbi:hemolysin family protein [Paenibacillus tarimensis]|uniref:hemolysin family protein n=1 Tax=Paenibacillus tarimensis TaxID=416012 RepID=UPI0038B300E3